MRNETAPFAKYKVVKNFNDQFFAADIAKRTSIKQISRTRSRGVARRRGGRRREPSSALHQRRIDAEGTAGGKSRGQARRLVRFSLLPACANWPFLTDPLPPPPHRQCNVLPARSTHITFTHTTSLVHSLFLRVPLFANRPPDNLAGNQTRGSHGVHSRTKDSHP